MNNIYHLASVKYSNYGSSYLCAFQLKQTISQTPLQIQHKPHWHQYTTRTLVMQQDNVCCNNTQSAQKQLGNSDKVHLIELDGTYLNNSNLLLE